MTEKKITVDTREAKAALDQLQLHSEMTAKHTMATIRKGVSSMLLLADVMGIVIPEYYNLMITAALMAGEMFTTLAAAESLTGIMIAKAIVTSSVAYLMFARAMQLRLMKSEAESRLNSMLLLLNLWG